MVLLLFGTALAYANEPPHIMEPSQATYTATEGDPLVIPFTVREPENDVVEYKIEHMIGDQVQPALPTGAVFETDPFTAERRLVWWPSLSQEGLYIFRFTAVDDKGLSAEKTVQVTVQDRTGTPAVKMTKFYPMPGYKTQPVVVDPIVIAEGAGDWFSVFVATSDPEGEAVSLDFAGIPKATVTPYTGGYNWQWYPGNPPASRPNVGLYTGQITATDASGNKTTMNLTLGVRRAWKHQQEMVYVRPVVQGGLVRTASIYNEASIVRGNITFGLESTRLWDFGPFPFPAEGRYRYVLHTPDVSGNDVKTYLSGILTGPQEITWNSATLPDGTYAVDTELLDGGTTPESDITRFRSRPLFVIVDNVPGPVTGPQWLPNTGFAGTKDIWYEPTAVQWIRFSGSPEQATIHPYPYHIVPVPETDTERQVLATSTQQWFAEDWLKPWNARYYPDPGFFRTQEDHLVVAGYNRDGSYDTRYVERYAETDGGRNQVSLTTLTSFRPDTGPGFLGVGMDGRLVRIDPINASNVAETIAGWVTRSDVVPFLPWDKNVTLDQRHQEQEQLVGSFENNLPFKYPRDLVIDPDNPNIIYVADTGNHRIALVDRSGQEARVTTFAGTPNKSGYQDGERFSALFNNPTSAEIVDGTLYVVDRGNFALRAIDLATGEVTTPVGKGRGALAVPSENTIRNNPDAWTWNSVSFSDATLVYPFWIRRYSNGDLLLAEAIFPVSDPNGNLRRIRFGKGRVDQLATPEGKPIRSIKEYAPPVPDWQGNVGPVDEVLMTGDNVGNAHGVFRIRSDGSVTRVIGTDAATFFPAGDTRFAEGTGSTSPTGGLVIDDEEARFAFTGHQQNGLIVLRPLEPGDPDPKKDMDLALSSRGRDLYLAGTILEFFPSAFRPSLASLHGRMGFNRFGNIPHFDDLVSRSDAELATYIRSGMAGQTARSELTGRDLQAMVYFLRVQSLQGKLETIDPEKIKRNLQAAGYWDNPEDTRLAEIRNVQATVVAANTAQITWQTDEPTIGLVQYGPTDYYGPASGIEPGYAKEHAIALENLQQDKRYYFRILSKDQAGNLTHRQGSFDVGTPPPPLCGDLNNDGKVSLGDVTYGVDGLLGKVAVPGSADPRFRVWDLNRNGRFDLGDLLRIVNHLLGRPDQFPPEGCS